MLAAAANDTKQPGSSSITAASKNIRRSRAGAAAAQHNDQNTDTGRHGKTGSSSAAAAQRQRSKHGHWTIRSSSGQNTDDEQTVEHSSSNVDGEQAGTNPKHRTVSNEAQRSSEIWITLHGTPDYRKRVCAAASKHGQQ